MSEQILIVDDSAFMRDLLRGYLEGHYDIIGEAEDGTEAVEMCKTEDVDIVMMDVVMEKRNGIEATDVIVNDLDDDISVIMCTSVSQEDRMREAVKAGAEGYITKPFQEEDVLDRIEDVTE